MLNSKDKYYLSVLLEIIVSCLYFSNKLLLLFEKKSGWVLGLAASALAMVYFFNLSLYLFFSLELACFVIMLMGLFAEKLSIKLAVIIYSIVALVMVYLLINIRESGWLEFITSILFMCAFLLLAKRKLYNGWLCLGISHGLMLLVTFEKGAYFFALMQGLSLLVCGWALWRVTKKRELLPE